MIDIRELCPEKAVIKSQKMPGYSWDSPHSIDEELSRENIKKFFNNLGDFSGKEELFNDINSFFISRYMGDGFTVIRGELYREYTSDGTTIFAPYFQNKGNTVFCECGSNNFHVLAEFSDYETFIICTECKNKVNIHSG